MQNVEIKKIRINLQWLLVIKKWIGIFLMKKQRSKQKVVTKSKNSNFIDLIRRTKIELDQAKNFFDNVIDPDLIDYASHKILANQSFYTYLIKKAKAENITFDV